MATIGIHTWEPGLVSGDTGGSSGGAAWLRYMVHHYSEAGHTVVLLGLTDPANPKDYWFVKRQVQSCDIILMPWRWRMPSYPDRDAIYLEQLDVIDYAISYDKRVIVHDEDHKISPTDESVLREAGIEIYAPEMFPRPGVKTLHYPYPFDDVEKNYSKPYNERKIDLTYIGNNYERFDQAERLISATHGMGRDKSIIVGGNWLEPKDGRESVDTVMARFPNVSFIGRILQENTLGFLNESIATIHLCKQSYAETGFITLRWAEAIAAGTIAFIPAEMVGLEDEPLAVNEASEVNAILDTIKKPFDEKFAFDFYAEELQWQRTFVRDIMRLEPWFELLK